MIMSPKMDENVKKEKNEKQEVKKSVEEKRKNAGRTTPTRKQKLKKKKMTLTIHPSEVAKRKRKRKKPKSVLPRLHNKQLLLPVMQVSIESFKMKCFISKLIFSFRHANY